MKRKEERLFFIMHVMGVEPEKASAEARISEKQLHKLLTEDGEFKRLHEGALCLEAKRKQEEELRKKILELWKTEE